MKRINLLLTFMLMTGSVLAQKKIENLEHYVASNGINYKVGDDIKLQRGSDTNGKFVYVTIGGWAVSTDPEANRLPVSNAGLIVTIKKIKKYNYKRHQGVFFTVGGGNITNYTIDIENAIATCEVENCKSTDQEHAQNDDKYDKLSKLKELLDGGVLTEEEYQAEKAKILNEQ